MCDNLIIETQTMENEMDVTTWVNSLTSEQYSRLLDIAHGEVPEEIKALSDDEILAELVD